MHLWCVLQPVFGLMGREGHRAPAQGLPPRRQESPVGSGWKQDRLTPDISTHSNAGRHLGKGLRPALSAERIVSGP